MVARSSVPVLGAQAMNGGDDGIPEGCPWLDPLRWEVSTGYRYLHSHRHFIGTTEQTQRATQMTEVNNKINLMDFSGTYKLTNRWTFSISMPVMIADRFSERTPDVVTHSRGIGDMSFGGNVWLFRPPTESRQNIQLGFAVKAPTGNPGVTDTQPGPNGTTRTVVVDQSIQLGDGGWGFSVSGQAYKGVHFATFFAAGTYLFNPADTNGVLTGRSRASEAIMSVPDQYLYRAGAVLPVPKIRSLVMSMGIRGEGVPVRDLIGKSNGFRRPGVAISVDPGFIYTRSKDQWSFNVPAAVYRNRKRSVTDIVDNTWGDAAFADYFFVVGYTRRF